MSGLVWRPSGLFMLFDFLPWQYLRCLLGLLLLGFAEHSWVNGGVEESLGSSTWSSGGRFVSCMLSISWH